MAMSKPHYQADQQAIVMKANGDFFLKPRQLSIVWGNDERYWKLPKEENDPVELIQVSWLEVTGTVPLKTSRKYTINFEVELAPDAFGWRNIQAFLMAKVGKKGRYKWIRVKLVQDSNGGKFTVPEENVPFVIEAPSDPSADHTLHFGLYEVWSGKWKGGLKIYGANVKDITG